MLFLSIDALQVEQIFKVVISVAFCKNNSSIIFNSNSLVINYREN